MAYGTPWERGETAPHPPRSRSKYVWTTKDGRQVRVRNMTDGHLVNTIRFLHRNAEAARDRDALGIESLSMFFSGEAATDDFDNALAHVEDQHPAEWLDENVPQYATMLREAKRRKLVEVKEQIEELEP